VILGRVRRKLRSEAGGFSIRTIRGAGLVFEEST